MIKLLDNQIPVAGYFGERFSWYDKYIMEVFNLEGLAKTFQTKNLSLIDRKLIFSSPLSSEIQLFPFGFTPVSIFLVAEVDIVTTNGVNLGRRQQSLQLGVFDFDYSNCGIARFHKINNYTISGVGIHTLAFIERICLETSRGYLMCSINWVQIENGSGNFLSRCGYSSIDKFNGKNSGSDCTVFAKDLKKTPLIKLTDLPNA